MLNLTPHAITISNLTTGKVITIPSTGVARVSTKSVNAGFEPHTGVCVRKTIYGEVEGLGNPSDHPDGVLVSGLVLGQLGPEWSGIAFAPGTGPNDNPIRNSQGHIEAVTCLITV